MGGLLFFVPVVLLMAVTFLAMWLLGGRAGHKGEGRRELLLLILIIGAATFLEVVLLLLLEEVIL
jgi:hypothetical protein